jgi:hypothetical protein
MLPINRDAISSGKMNVRRPENGLSAFLRIFQIDASTREGFCLARLSEIVGN